MDLLTFGRAGTWVPNQTQKGFGDTMPDTKHLTARELAELPYLTLEQCAALLQVSTEHVRRKARANDVPGLERVLGVWRVRTAELLGAER
jgi:hypothetical protein